MALRGTQDDGLLVSQSRQRTQSLFLSTWMATQKPIKTNHEHMTPTTEKDMKRMIAIPPSMAMIETTIATVTIIALLMPLETRLIHMSLHLILIVITVATTKLQSPILLLLLVLRQRIPLILMRQLTCLIDSTRKAVNCQRREMIYLQTQLNTCCRTFFQLDVKNAQRTGCGNIIFFFFFSPDVL